MVFEAGIVGADFGPESSGMIWMVDMRKFVDNNVVSERLRDVHEANI